VSFSLHAAAVEQPHSILPALRADVHGEIFASRTSSGDGRRRSFGGRGMDRRREWRPPEALIVFILPEQISFERRMATQGRRDSAGMGDVANLRSKRRW